MSYIDVMTLETAKRVKVNANESNKLGCFALDNLPENLSATTKKHFAKFGYLLNGGIKK